MNTDEFEGHTPAPWKMHKISGGSAFGYLTVMMSDGQQIKQMYGMNGADARLIAAAPDLLAEVKRLENLCDELWNFIETYSPHMISEATDIWNQYSIELCQYCGENISDVECECEGEEE